MENIANFCDIDINNDLSFRIIVIFLDDGKRRWKCKIRIYHQDYNLLYVYLWSL